MKNHGSMKVNTTLLFLLGFSRQLTTQGFVQHSCCTRPQSFATHLFAEKKRPSLVIFDLDNTLWTPELYQLRKHQRNGNIPQANRDVKLFEGARQALDWLDDQDDISLAVASRTKSGEWAHDLLEQFGLKEKFLDLQIFPGDKKKHFLAMKENTGIPFEEMLFFDDNRDGKYGNCVPVSELGVLCCHCPGGIESEDFFHQALDRFHEWDGTPRTIVEWDGSVTQVQAPKKGERIEGRVKRVFDDKGYGFIDYGDRSTRDLFFHFNDLPPGSNVEPGDEMTFVVGENRGKPLAKEIEVLSGAKSVSENKITIRAFSMNLPFAALLANGYKDLETRNGTMFIPYEPGTKFILQVGQRTYPDGNRHLEIMKSGGLSDEEIENLKSLQVGGKGMAVAILEIGDTYETTVEERSDPEMQRRIGAYGTDSGMRCTEIRRIEYLKQPVKVKANGGVFKINIDRDVIPDGWLDE